jgi:hypothetical protein
MYDVFVWFLWYSFAFVDRYFRHVHIFSTVIGCAVLNQCIIVRLYTPVQLRPHLKEVCKSSPLVL